MNNPYFEKNHARGFGSYPLKGDQLEEAVLAALEVGYRAFDTAQMYGNEADLGAILARSSVPQDELFITTKVHPDNFSAERFAKSVEKSMKDLRREQLDVLLLHWPPADGEIQKPLKLLAEVYNAGLTKAIGVSNFNNTMMRQIKDIIDAPVVINQVEFHPLLDQNALLNTAKATGIPLSSYCSVARGEVFKYPLFGEIGEQYHKSAAQVVLRYILQNGVALNTMSRNPKNIQANYDIDDFELSADDMARIAEMGQTNYRIVTDKVSPWAPEWD